MRLNSTAETCRTSRKERPGQIHELVTGEKRRIRPRTIENNKLARGPASDIALNQKGLRMRQRSIYTAPPGSPIPPMKRKSNGRTMENTGCVYFRGLKVRYPFSRTVWSPP